jgi:hypothetical protein
LYGWSKDHGSVWSTSAGVSGPAIRSESRWLPHFPARLREGYDPFGAPGAEEDFVLGMLRQNVRHIKPIPHTPGAATPQSQSHACFRVGPVRAAASKGSSPLGFWIWLEPHSHIEREFLA